MEKSKQAAPKKPFKQIVATNRKAYHDYLITDKIEAGLELKGSEVKSLRTKNVQFADCYARVYDNECWLIGLQLNTYEKTHVQVPDPTRRRKLLLHRREIDKLRAKTEKSGHTLVPLEIYFHGPWAKVLLGLGKGKTHGDKRAALKAAEVRRDIDRVLRTARK
ncbi:MAG TPA: SsrA-binding protein SmpB [Planctomycetota bacterium]|nr:SsrA-binding protein SmpB [Planctomycetota bacterium]